MGYIEQFIEVLTEHSNAKCYHEAIAEWVDRGERFDHSGFCICGHIITENCVVVNKLNGNRLVVGNCCIKKFGLKRENWNRSPKAYLEYALTKASSSKTQSFVTSLLERKARYGKLLMSKKQKEWLETITQKPYRWIWSWE